MMTEVIIYTIVMVIVFAVSVYLLSIYWDL